MFAAGADLEEIRLLARNPLVAGFTTNPTLMKKAGVYDYIGFSQQAIEIVYPKPISLEVFSLGGSNVYAKIPVTNTAGVSTKEVLSHLTSEGIKLKVTALTIVTQVQEVTNSIAFSVPTIISVFAGRIADTGLGPVPTMTQAKLVMESNHEVEFLWASPREILNLVQAKKIECDIISMKPDRRKKIPRIGTDLTQLSRETVKMFSSMLLLLIFQLPKGRSKLESRETLA